MSGRNEGKISSIKLKQLINNQLILKGHIIDKTLLLSLSFFSLFPSGGPCF